MWPYTLWKWTCTIAANQLPISHWQTDWLEHVLTYSPTKPSGYGRGILATHNNPNLDWIVTFRQHTYADKYYTGGTLYTVASPATSANACFLWFFTIFFTPKSSSAWLVAWFSQISLCVTLWCNSKWCQSKRWLRTFSWIQATANFLKYGYDSALFLFKWQSWAIN